MARGSRAPAANPRSGNAPASRVGTRLGRVPLARRAGRGPAQGGVAIRSQAALDGSGRCPGTRLRCGLSHRPADLPMPGFRGGALRIAAAAERAGLPERAGPLPRRPDPGLRPRAKACDRSGNARHGRPAAPPGRGRAGRCETAGFCQRSLPSNACAPPALRPPQVSVSAFCWPGRLPELEKICTSLCPCGISKSGTGEENSLQNLARE